VEGHLQLVLRWSQLLLPAAGRVAKLNNYSRLPEVPLAAAMTDPPAA